MKRKSIHSVFSKNILLNEISKENYKKVKDWFVESRIEGLSFNELFGGKQRIAIPFRGGGMKGKIGEILGFLQRNGWDIDLSNGTASRRITVSIPKGEKRGDVVEKVQKMRIGKLLNFFPSFIKNARKKGKSKEKEKINKKFHNLFPKFGNDLKLMEILFGDKDEDDPRPKYEQWIEFWNKKSEDYIKNPDVIEEDIRYYIILSRHPIDVLRMSDFSDIKSCHTEGSEFFRCAIAESRGHGPVAYIVKKEDLDKVDLENEEIFADKIRKIEGIVPLSRLRMRKFKHKEKEHELAIPELSVYGSNIPGFKQELKKFLIDKQKHLFDKDEVNLGDFIRFGGSYGDNKDGALFNSFFDTTRFPDMNTEHVYEPEDDYKRIFDEWEHRKDELLDEANKNVKYWTIEAELEDIDGEPFLEYSAVSGYGFNNKNPNMKLNFHKSGGYDRKRKLEDKIYKIISQDYYPNSVDFYDSREYVNISILDKRPFDDNSMPPNPDGLENFIKMIKEDVVPYYTKHKNEIKNLLILEGILLPDKEYRIIKKFKSDPYKNFSVYQKRKGDIEVGLPRAIKISSFKEDIDFVNKTENFNGWFEQNFIQNLTKLSDKASEFASKQLTFPNISGPTYRDRTQKLWPGEMYIQWYTKGSLKMDFGFTMDESILNDVPSLLTTANFFDFLDNHFNEFYDIAIKTFVQTKEEIEEAKDVKFESVLKNYIQASLAKNFHH